MKKMSFASMVKSPFCLVFILVILFSACSKAPESHPAAGATPAAPSVPALPRINAPTATLVLADFERDDPADLANNLGGPSGSWNMDPSDINNSYTDADIVGVEGPAGAKTKVLRLNYSVESDRPAQNGFWTKLDNLDAQKYDHLEIVLKGDALRGFTDKFKIEFKKCKQAPCVGDPAVDEEIKGSYIVPVTDSWQTVRIPLNKITGIIDFADQGAWKDPSISRKNLDEFVIVFNDRMVSKKSGTLYVDEIRLVTTGRPGPTAVDSPDRSREKTPTRLTGVAYANFLIGRLGGFPKRISVKKEFPKDDRAFLMEIAKDTWRFFDEITDKERGLVLDTIRLGEKEPVDEKTIVGDYTNVTNIGIYLMAVVSAYDLGLIGKDDAVGRIRKTLAAVEALEHHESGFPYNYYDTTLAEKTSYFVSFVDSAWLMAGYYVVKNAFPPEVGEMADKALKRGNLGFFYNQVERQMFHGYYGHLDVYSNYNYGAFYTETRPASYMAIARGEVPKDHWFGGLVRTFPGSFVWQNQKPAGRAEKTVEGFPYYGGYYEWNGVKYVPSWGGSAFEALMPTLVLKEKELAPQGLGLNDKNHVYGQIHYALDELGYPVWGMSPSSDPEGTYSEFGVKPFGSKGYKSGTVTPHASVLALEFDPAAVIKNLRKMIELYDIYGEYGFYDAVNPATGLVARKYLALDQGMILVAINNYLNNGAIRKRFHADPVMQKAVDLLTSEKLFE